MRYRYSLCIFIVLFSLCVNLLADNTKQLSDINRHQSPSHSASEKALTRNVIISPINEAIKVKLNGRLQIGYVSTARNSQKIENQSDVERVWLTLSGAYEKWYFLTRFNIDRDENSVPLSTFIEYRGLGNVAYISFGRHKEPFGMSWVGSIKHVSTPERSAVSDRYTFGRSVGIVSRGKFSQGGYQVGLFEDNKQEFKKKAEHIALTGRLFYHVLFDTTHTAHIGTSFSSRQDQNSYAIETAFINGQFHMQSEWMTSHPKQGERVNISGAYIEVGIFSTKDSMNYKNGVFKDVIPNNSKGAWQWIFRYDNGEGNYSDIELGKGDGEAFAIGINWFANQYSRLALSYMRGRVEKNKGQELRLRTQFVF